MHAHAQIMHIPTLENLGICRIEHGGAAKVGLDAPRSCINSLFSLIICICVSTCSTGNAHICLEYWKDSRVDKS
jgi:hypothetical protein